MSTIEEILTNVKEAFETQATKPSDEDDAEPRLLSPGVEGIQEFLSGILEEDNYTEDAIRGAYELQQWPEDQSLLWCDVKTLVSSLMKEDAMNVDAIANEGVIPAGVAPDLVRESFEKKAFVHRIEEEKFISLISVEDITDNDKKNFSLATLSKVKGEHINAIDAKLWKEWASVEEVLDMTEANPLGSFFKFIDEEYVVLIDQVFNASNKEAFKPPVEPDEYASVDEAIARSQLLSEASLSEKQAAEKEMNRMYVAWVKTKNEKQQKHLPAVPPRKYAAKNFYDILKKGVDDKSGITQVATPQTAGSSADTLSPASISTQRPTVTEPCGSLEALLAGTEVYVPATPSISVKYASSFEIMESGNELSKCQYQGLLTQCLDQPRIVEFTEESPRKRKGNMQSTRAADFILLDKTGPVYVTVWEGLAERICEEWREVEAARAQGQSLRKIINLSIVRVQSVAKSKWNGELLSHFRTLASIAAVGATPGTELTVVEKPTAQNMLPITTFKEPSARCCVANFQWIRSKLQAPFRATLKGVIADLLDPEYTQSQKVKRIFDLVDPQGLYITCCAMFHNSMSLALKNQQEVILFFGTGRGPIGSSEGMVYLMADAMILAVGAPRSSSPIKREKLAIALGNQ